MADGWDARWNASDDVFQLYPRAEDGALFDVDANQTAVGDGNDVHGVDDNLSTDHVQRINEGMLGLASAFGSEVVWLRQHALNPKMLMGQCAIDGIAPLVVETGTGGMIDA